MIDAQQMRQTLALSLSRPFHHMPKALLMTVIVSLSLNDNSWALRAAKLYSVRQ